MFGHRHNCHYWKCQVLSNVTGSANCVINIAFLIIIIIVIISYVQKKNVPFSFSPLINAIRTLLDVLVYTIPVDNKVQTLKKAFG